MKCLDMDSDDDFIAPNQYRTQYRSNSAMSQTVTSSSARQARASGNPGTSQVRKPSQDARLSQLQEGVFFLLDSLQEITGSQLEHRAIKRPAEQKPFDKKPNTKEECQLCKKLYANKTTLFRHYRAMHQEMNPEKYHGCSVNNTVVSLDASFKDTECSICGYIAVNQTALAQHNRSMHNNDAPINSINASANKENTINNVNVKDKMHKCEHCACYFEERSKFDEHMKSQHGFVFECKTCNKYIPFKDIDRHVKDSHPDVYNKKDKEDKVIVEKILRNKKGKRVRLFACIKCDHKFYDRTSAQKHGRAHKKALKVKFAINKCKSDEFIDLTDDNVIFTCEACDVSTGSYDAVVEHSQNHITDMLNVQLVQTCPVCELKFEPLCYKTHMDLHYKNKEIHKETFKYFKYKFQLLLNDNWVNSFDNEAVKNMMSKSIYEKTRSVKMRVLHEGRNILYKCCQCDNFVDPKAVLNHALNYDTCVKLKSSYACDICKRTFNNRLTRDDHKKDHNGEEFFKVVLFNNENDREFNKVLNDPGIVNISNTFNTERSDDVNDAKVIYKCLCGLCFVRKESADVHTKTCPGKNPKKSCPKCSNMFDSEELLAHCFEHHLNETRIVIENFSPDVIEIEDDEPENANGEQENGNNKKEENVNNTVIEIDSSDDEDQHQRNGFNNVNIEIVKSEDTNSIQNEIDKQGTNNTTEVEQNVAQLDTSTMNIHQNGPRLDTIATESGMNVDDEGLDNLQDMLEEVNDDSQDTITRENTESDENNSAPKNTEIKCVPTNLLLNPFNFENSFLNRVEIVRRDIVTKKLIMNEVHIKEEKPWWFDPTDYSKICRRPSLRQIEASSSSQVILESLLTDDEEESETSAVPQSTSNNEFNEISEQQKDVSLNENLNSNVKSVDNSKTVDNTQPKAIENIDKALAHTNREEDRNEINVDDILNSNMNEESDADDDLFLPSGKENTDVSHDFGNTLIVLQNKDKEVSQDYSKEQIPCTNPNSIEESANARFENATNNADICNKMQGNPETENTMYVDPTKENSSTDNDGIQTIDDEDTIDYEDINETILTKNGASDDNTMGNEEINPITTPTTIVHNNMKDSNEGIPKTPTSFDLLTAFKKEIVEHEIKTELITQNSEDVEIDCDKLVEIKTEPNYRLEMESHKDSHVDVDNNTCCVC